MPHLTPGHGPILTMPAFDLNALLALLPLAELPRTGWVQTGLPPGIAPETIASHGHMVALLVMQLGSQVDPPLDVHRAVALAVAHDAAEAWTGDLPKPAAHGLPKGAKKDLEWSMIEQKAPHLGPYWLECESMTSREARLVKLCDTLQMGLFAIRLKRAGHTGMGSFMESVQALDASEFAVTAELQALLVQEWSG